MILVIKITEKEFDDFGPEFINSLDHNISNSLISRIIIFVNFPYFNLNKLKTIVIQNNGTDVDLLKQVCKIYPNKTIIWANKFAKFDNTLSKLNKVDLIENLVYVNSKFDGKENKKSLDALIFNSNSKIEYSDNIIDSIMSKKISLDINVINKKPDINTEKVMLKVLKQSPRRISIKNYETIITKKEIYKLSVIIVSVNYNDYLLVSLSNNIKYFEDITVVTSSDDLVCQKICDIFGVKCIITDRIYEDGASFNKGKAINDGIKSIDNPDWILLLDADIVLTKKIDINDDVDVLHTSDRYICKDYNTYKDWQGGKIEIDKVGKYETNRGLGFFHLFNINSSDINKELPFPESSNDAAWSDLHFRDKFTKKSKIDKSVIHLGPTYKNWKGRKTDAFLSDDLFNELYKKQEVTEPKYKEFELNTYFDKIYCLNLKKRENRWIYSNYQFNNNNISVERYDAIDGELIDFNDNDINLESFSRKGIIESKGALGCLKSHLEIIKDAKSKNYKRILIFEDDILLSDNFNEEVKKIENIDWNLLYLGASQFEWSNIKPENGLYKCSKTLGTFAYALDISIYDEILKTEESSKKSIDNILSDIQKSNDKCYTLFPNIVISDVLESDIRSPKSIVEYSNQVKWNLDKFKKYYDKKYFVEKINDKINLFDIESVIHPIGQQDLIDFEVVNISTDKGKKVLFLIYFNDVGGAEYVSYQHIKACKELGYKPVVISANKGMFFDKIKDLDVDLFYSKIDNLDKDSIISLLDKLSDECEIIYNCNYFEITKYIYLLKKIKSFKYYTIAHSDIEWIINSISEHDEITDKYIVIHDKIRKELNNKNICNTKIVTIPNYIDFDNIHNNYISFNNKDIKIKYGIGDNDFIIGMISRISPDKNIIDALKVIKKTNISNIKLLIVGDSSNTKESILYKEVVLKKINELKLNKKVIITGHVDNSDIYKFISCFNTSINTSPSEGLPISLLEQMACGLHSIFPSHGEIPDVLEGYGSVINLKQKKSFNKLDIDNYIYSGYSDSELNLFVDEINRVYNNIKVDKEKISNHIKLTRSSESIKYYLDYLFGGYKKGVSFIIRARDEEVNVSACLENISNIADEIIFVDHLSTDNTYKIAFELSKKHSNIKVFKYKNEVPRPGDNYNKNISVIGNSISNYYNFCLTKATKYNVIKWDADFLPNTKNLMNMIDSLDLKNREDKFSLWFTGETMFIDNGLSYINKNSYYDEYRAFSLLNGVKWEDAIRCEHIDPNYIEDSVKIRYELPCFYEIKRTDINEFELRDSLIDKRDVDDYNIINNLKQGIITKNLKKYEI